MPWKSLPDRHNAELTTRQTYLACFPCAVFQSHAQTTPISCHPTDPSHASKSPTVRRAGPPPAVAVAVAVAVAKWPWSRSPRSKRHNRNLLFLLHSLPRLCYPLLAHRPTFPRRRRNTTFPSRWPRVGNARLRRPDCLFSPVLSVLWLIPGLTGIAVDDTHFAGLQNGSLRRRLLFLNLCDEHLLSASSLVYLGREYARAFVKSFARSCPCTPRRSLPFQRRLRHS